MVCKITSAAETVCSNLQSYARKTLGRHLSTSALKFFSFGYSCFMIVIWLEIHGVFLRFFPLFNSVTSVLTAYDVCVFKPTVYDRSNSSY